jgi:hypothetical protein
MSDDLLDPKSVFTAALAGDDGGAGPDMDVILTGGRRRRRRRTLAVTGGFATLAAVAVGLGIASAAGTAGTKGTPAPAVLAGQASTPALPPHDLSPRNTTKVQAQVLAALRKHLPAGLSISDGSGPSSFLLTRPDGTGTSLGTLVGSQRLEGLPNPCVGDRYNSACVRVDLPDGSRGWAWVTDGGRGEGGAVSVSAVTLDGQVFGLLDDHTEVLPRGAGPLLTEKQMIALVEQPDVLAALKNVPTDEPVSAPPGVPHTS